MLFYAIFFEIQMLLHFRHITLCYINFGLLTDIYNYLKILCISNIFYEFCCLWYIIKLN